ncbi:hypothetical protein ABZ863_18740 [Saccharomonospora sp. NPDC046836]|uniref:hypothetical protein n=1 Tax=Saccharomonospora sp. NPDC046836 TaxID=3156921 RepID=UPI0033D64965
MNPVEITFGPGVAESAEWYSLLRRVPCDGGPGSWPAGTSYVEMIRRLDGGRSGGVVLLAEIHHGPVNSLCVIKIDCAEVLVDEWAAHQNQIAPLTSALFAPVIAATPDVVAGRAEHDDLGAVVYSEASEYTGQAGDTVRTLGELVSEAEANPEVLPEALHVLEHALRGAMKPLYGDHELKDGKSSLRYLNKSLGPSLDLRVDDGPAETMAHDLVLRRTLGGFDEDLRTGDRIRLRDLSKVDGLLSGDDFGITTGDTDHNGDFACGTVMRSRGRERRARLLDAIQPTEIADGWWQVGDVVVADPFIALETVLTDTVANRVLSRSHGDLNTTNVVVVGGHPCFIDYARTTRRAPQQADHTWLEVSFLRDQFAHLPFDLVVAVQRALAVSSMLLQLDVPADEARHHGRELLGAAPTIAFEVLFTVRKFAHQCYPHDAGAEWWKDHLCHLLIAAHRTFKWTGEVQTPAKLRVAAAAASVATEWLTDGSPFTHWPQHKRDRTIDQLRGPYVKKHGSEVLRHVRTNLQSEHETFIDVSCEANEYLSGRRSAVAAAEQPMAAVLTGGARSGKTRVLDEAAHRTAVAGKRVPLLLNANDINSPLLTREALCFDALHLFVDGLDEAPDRAAAVAALGELRENHPGLPILVCSRSVDGLSSFDEVRLAGFDEEALRAHLYRTAPASTVPVLLHTLLDDPAWQALDLRRPRSLAILDEHLQTGELPSSPAAAHEAMLRGELAGSQFNEAVELAARRLDEDTAIADAASATTAPFTEPSDQHFLAALALRRLPVSEVAQRVNAPAWDAALRVLVSMPDAPDDVVRQVVAALVNVDPVRAGHLLRAAHSPPKVLLAAFVSTQQEALKRNDPGGLAALGSPRAVAEVVVDRHAGTPPRLTGLVLLQQFVDKARPGAEHRRARTALTDVVGAVLGEPNPSELLVLALGCVVRFELRGLELHLADHLTERHPWQVVHAAAETLCGLGVRLTEPARQTYHRRARARLDEVVNALWRTADLAVARSLTHERHTLLRVLADHPSSVDVLLRHRFALDVVGADALLDRWLPHDAEEEPSSLFGQITDGDPAAVVAAAHRLLKEWNQAERLLALVGDDPDLIRLLVAAAAVMVAKPVNRSNTDRAEKLFLAVLPHVETDRLEGVSALLLAISRVDPARAARLASTAAKAFTERRFPARLYWPWKSVFSRCRGRIADIELMLCGSEQQAALAVYALGSWDVPGTGRPGPGKLSAEAEEALWRARPEADAPALDIDSWARAVAAVGFPRALPHLRELLETVPDAPVEVGTDGGVEQHALRDVLRRALAHLEQSTQGSVADHAMP